ncbi:MAG: aldo/keto reductase [Marinilabiliaceae bacterium]|jgi:aryl-alcohol dehydrogenase-like predicted oxidoreductase|nr:aldo/keto reductase [Marinilabiliaceae bacterium]
MKKISRKEFLLKTSAGVAGLTIMPHLKSQVTVGKTGLRELGKTGIMVSPLCFGASRTMDEGLIKAALDRDINFLDTGRSYARGNNEKLVGRVIAGIRNKVVIQSKMHLEREELTHEGKGKKGAREIKDILNGKIEESLKALNTDYIDIMLYHSAEHEDLTFHDAVLEFYSSLKSSGVIRAHGFSSHDYGLNLVKRNNLDKFYDVIMHPFNYKGAFVHSLSKWSASWDQDLLISLLDEASRQGTGIVAMKTCSAGPFNAGEENESSYRQAVAWVLEKDYIHSAAVAMSSYEQLEHHTL